MIEVSGICKSYRKREILSGISFRAQPGSCVGIVGGNGCGKTTLLSILAGTLKPDQGSVLYDGEEAVGRPRLFEKKVAYVPQENPIMDELSVKDNLRLWYKGEKGRLKEDLEHGVANTLGIHEFLNMPAGKLSGGQKKRLSLACALSNHASVLIMDEPGAALDLICKEQIRKYLTEYRKTGGIVILTSHEMAELSLCSEMYVLNDKILKKIPVASTAEILIREFL